MSAGTDLLGSVIVRLEGVHRRSGYVEVGLALQELRMVRDTLDGWLPERHEGCALQGGVCDCCDRPCALLCGVPS